MPFHLNFDYETAYAEVPHKKGILRFAPPELQQVQPTYFSSWKENWSFFCSRWSRILHTHLWSNIHSKNLEDARLKSSFSRQSHTAPIKTEFKATQDLKSRIENYQGFKAGFRGFKFSSAAIRHWTDHPHAFHLETLQPSKILSKFIYSFWPW